MYSRWSFELGVSAVLLTPRGRLRQFQYFTPTERRRVSVGNGSHSDRALEVGCAHDRPVQLLLFDMPHTLAAKLPLGVPNEAARRISKSNVRHPTFRQQVTLAGCHLGVEPFALHTDVGMPLPAARRREVELRGPSQLNFAI